MSDKDSPVIEPALVNARQPSPARAAACPKCGGTMATGRLLTVGTALHANNNLIAWAAGQLRRGWFKYVGPPDGRRHSIVTYKCDRCGYLESYGQPG